MSFLHSLISPFLSLTFNFRSKKRLPKIEGSLEVYGLKEPVTINRDKWGVPHIQANNDRDLFFAQGFAHCQDRLFQMEINRRVAKGTLSEIFGEPTVPTDRLSRTMGFHRMVKEDIKLLSDDARQTLESYVSGINAYINHLDTTEPLEFSLVKFKPTNWTIEDCMAIGRMMVWQLSHAWYGETIRAQMIAAVGEENASLLEIQYREDNPIQLPNGIEFNKLVKGELKKESGPFLDNAAGSNGWVIAGSRSKTGSPILANDMHLSLKLPSIWYQNHLRSRDLNITGVSIPGLPMIMVGHNDEVAWGATLSFNDCEDLFVEKFSTEDDDIYEFKGKEKEAEVIYEIIKVKDGLNQQEKVVITDHGPIISNFVETKEKLALQSKSLQPLTAINGWCQINRASGWDDFVNGIRQINAPSLNFVYADEENIGYYNSGEVPIRKKGDGRIPVPGWTGEYDWKGTIPFEEMPHTLNPESGYFITTNNKVISDDYKYDLGGNFMNGFRAKRLTSYFEEHEKLGIEECKMMQLDVFCEPVILFLQHYVDLEMTDPNPDVLDAFKIFKQFDGYITTDSVGATLYEVTRHMMTRTLLEQHLGKKLTDQFMGEGLHEVLLPSHEFYGQDLVVLLRLLDEPDNWWISEAGGKQKLLNRAFKRAFEYLRKELGNNYKKWEWGRLHKISFDHPLSVRPILKGVFSRGPYPMPGDTDTPNQMASMPHDFGVSSWAPSWRQIIDMGNLPNSVGVYAPGQSGQLASKHYDDLIPMWSEGKYYTLLWTRGQIENASEGELKLTPPKIQ